MGMLSEQDILGRLVAVNYCRVKIRGAPRCAPRGTMPDLCPTFRPPWF